MVQNVLYLVTFFPHSLINCIQLVSFFSFKTRKLPLPLNTQEYLGYNDKSWRVYISSKNVPFDARNLVTSLFLNSHHVVSTVRKSPLIDSELIKTTKYMRNSSQKKFTHPFVYENAPQYQDQRFASVIYGYRFEVSKLQAKKFESILSS